MKKLLLLLIIPFLSFGQGWIQTYWSTNNNISGRIVKQTDDGGYIVTGGVKESNDYDVYLIKTDADGNEQWSQTYGGTEGDEGVCVQQTSDGGYIISASTKSFGNGLGDVYLIKTDADGNEQWSQTYGGTENDGGWGVQQTSDGGYIISASTNSFGNGGYDYWLIKTDLNGDSIWTQTYGGTSSEYAGVIQQTSDGGYVVVGGGDMDDEGAWLIKTDINGDSVWTQTCTAGSWVRCVQQTSDAGYVLGGTTSSYPEDPEYYLIKINENGEEQWYQTYGEDCYEDPVNLDTDYCLDWGFWVEQTSDGGYIMSGIKEDITEMSQFGEDRIRVQLIKTDSEGNVTSTNIIETPAIKKNLITKVDILGRETNNEGFQLHIYDDGSVEKKYLIE